MSAVLHSNICCFSTHIPFIPKHHYSLNATPSLCGKDVNYRICFQSVAIKEALELRVAFNQKEKKQTKWELSKVGTCQLNTSLVVPALPFSWPSFSFAPSSALLRFQEGRGTECRWTGYCIDSLSEQQNTYGLSSGWRQCTTLLSSPWLALRLPVWFEWPVRAHRKWAVASAIVQNKQNRRPFDASADGAAGEVVPLWH